MPAIIASSAPTLRGSRARSGYPKSTSRSSRGGRGNSCSLARDGSDRNEVHKKDPTSARGSIENGKQINARSTLRPSEREVQ